MAPPDRFEIETPYDCAVNSDILHFDNLVGAVRELQHADNQYFLPRNNSVFLTGTFHGFQAFLAQALPNV